MAKTNLPVAVDHVAETPEPAEIFGELVNVPKGAQGQKPKSDGFQTTTTPDRVKAIRLEQ